MRCAARFAAVRGWIVLLVVPAVVACSAWTESRPSGIVRGRGEAFADDRGPFLALGATLFWGPWGYKFDRARLDRHLQFLSERGVDYVRVLGQVGRPDSDSDDSWSDRPIDPRWRDACTGSSSAPPSCGTYDEVIAGFTDLAFDRYGLRVEWTIFGGTGFTPTPESRLALVDRLLAMSKGREHKIMHFEVANEFYHNGFEGPEGLAELRRLGRHLQERTMVPVALSAPRGSNCSVMQQLYAGGIGELVTEHFDRSGEDGGWAAVQSAWELQFCEGLPPLRSSNEPIGPFSSVRAEADPVRLAMSAAVAYVSGIGAYVLHTGPGIRGGGQVDLERGRPADIWAVPDIDRILSALGVVTRTLPPDVPTWSRRRVGRADPVVLLAGSSGPVKGYIALQDRRFVMTPLALEGPLTIEARVAADVSVVHPESGAVLYRGSLEAGERTTVAGSPAYLVLGEAKS
ncbi:MAG TPA: hypothetical protein VD833_00730 [Vicinamibacterales bacterium]|nr:hypothetical protein [Vicinamibacterales bacterium]